MDAMSMSDSSQSKFSPRTGSAQQRPVTYLSIGQVLRCHVAGKSMEQASNFLFIIVGDWHQIANGKMVYYYY
jgi:hypothetical protein